MDEVIWVEVLSRHRHVVSRHRCAGPEIRIGRAYDNDVILDDPYVAPEHVRIARGGDGVLAAVDLGSANGLHADHGGSRATRLALGDDTVFRVGNTWLRVRTADHPVAAERVFAAQQRLWPLILGAASGVFAVAASVLWIGTYSEPRAADYIVPLLGLAVAIAVWTSAWAAVSRLFIGQARFEQHLLITLAGVLGLEAWYELSDLGAFGFSWNALVVYRFVGLWALVALVALVHLRQINPARVPLEAAVVAALLAIAVTVQTATEFDGRSSLDQFYVRRLLPPALRLTRVEDEASFFAAVTKLQDQLDRDRAAEP